ncbi:MAG: GNAT family N-acetyltransferase [Deinococcales bacterium]
MLGVLGGLEPSLKAAAHHNRDHYALKGFDVFIDPKSEASYLSLAIPKTHADASWTTSWTEAIAEMQALFKSLKRQARLEYFHELYPSLADTLLAAGFKEEMRAPIMVLDKANLTTTPQKLPNTHYLPLRVDDSALIEQSLRCQSLAYGGDGGDGALIWLANLLTGLADGSKKMSILLQDDAPVAGAVLQIGGGIAELAGVWTLPEKQKQGLAFSFCQQFLAEYFAEGYQRCWLSAAEGAQRLYEKLGFVKVGTQLNFAQS